MPADVRTINAISKNKRGKKLNDQELNLRAGIGAFADENGTVPPGIKDLDFINRDTDCMRLLIATGISFTRPHDGEIGAEGGMQEAPVFEKVHNGDVVAAARRAAARVAAAWVSDADVALHHSAR